MPNVLRFKPQLWPTLITIPCLLLVIGLGTWQVLRLEWKSDLISAIRQELSTEARPLEPNLTLQGRYDYRHLALQGEFRHEKELHLAARYHRGQLGYHLLTPFILADGRVLLVNRGWVPQEKIDPAKRTETLTLGPQSFRAMAHAPSPRGLFTPENNAQKNMWFWIDLPAMREATGLPLEAVVADAIAVEAPGGLPVSATGKVEIQNDHLQYAITWFCLALAIIVIYVVYHRKEHP